MPSASPESEYEVTFGPVVAISTNETLSADRSTENPDSFVELSDQVTVTADGDVAVAAAPEGAAGGEISGVVAEATLL